MAEKNRSARTAARRVSAARSGRPRTDVRGCRCSARRSRSTPRSSTTREGDTLAAASSLEKDLRGKLKTGADVEAAKEVGTLVAERADAGRRQAGRLRPLGLPLSRPRQGAGRSGPRRRAGF